MADIIISGELAQQLQALAAQKHSTVEEVLAGVIAQEQASSPANEKIENDPRYQEVLQRLRPGLYKRARQYWQQVGDQARLGLTDGELDERFWLIDSDGIPRLKGDEAHIDENDEGLTKVLDRIWLDSHKPSHADNVTVRDDDTRRILSEEFADNLWRRMNANDEA